MNTGTPCVINTLTSNVTYPIQPLFLVVWQAYRLTGDDYEDRLRVWGIYANEAESKRALEEARQSESGLAERGGFTWMRIENINHGPSDLQKAMDFDIGD